MRGGKVERQRGERRRERCDGREEGRRPRGWGREECTEQQGGKVVKVTKHNGKRKIVRQMERKT